VNLIGFIPARGGSKGVPGKNKKILCGKPLIQYTIDAALQSKLSALVVSSDDEEILQLANAAGIHAVKRPEQFASDLAPTLQALQHALANVLGQFDAVMTLQPTSPLRKTVHINEAIALFENDANADSLVSVVQAPHKFTGNSLMIKNGVYIQPAEAGELVLRRQDKPVLWGRNGAAIYITRINKVEEYIFGGNIIPYEMTKSESIDIDDMEDWKLAAALIQYESKQD
jgi:CMP-N,N'-diacetyllegionaminic acid synthase